MISALLGGRTWASFSRLSCVQWLSSWGASLVVQEWVYGIKFDFGSPRSAVVRDRPGHS